MSAAPTRSPPKNATPSRDGDAASADREGAIQMLRAQQNAYFISAVRSALEAEERRKARLAKVSTHLEAKRLEKQFARERSKDKERLAQIQDDHTLLLNARIEEWEANSGAGIAPAPAPTARSTVRVSKKRSDGDGDAKPVVKLSKERLERLSMPRLASESRERGADRPTSASRTQGDTSQEIEFYKSVYRKQDRARLASTTSLPALNPASLRAMSEVDLLRRKQSLLSELHGVVAMQERILRDDEWTVRSSVSSWTSGATSRSAYRPST